MSTNPWVRAEPVAQAVPTRDHPTGPTIPQPSIRAFGAAALGSVTVAPARVFIVGAHGGAGESTIAQLHRGAAATDHRWPVVPGATARVVLVARHDHHGLRCLQSAAAQWASRRVEGVELLGAAVVPDAPGRAPKANVALAHLVGGGVPYLWHLPYVEAWRAAPATIESAPRSLMKVIDSIEKLSR